MPPSAGLPEFDLMAGVYRDPTLLWTLPCAVLALLLLRFASQKVSLGAYRIFRAVCRAIRFRAGWVDAL